MKHRYHCDCCNKTYKKEETVPGIEGTILGALTGLAIGASTRNGPAALLFCVAGAMVGRVVDEEVAPRCPQCAGALKAVARTFLSAQGFAAPLKLLALLGVAPASRRVGVALPGKASLRLPRL